MDKVSPECNLRCWSPESRESPVDQPETPEESARCGGDWAPGLSPWPEAQALTHALQVAMAYPALLAMGRRPGPCRCSPVPQGAEQGVLLAATLTGTRNQKQLRARGAQRSSRRRWRVHRTDTL